MPSRKFSHGVVYVIHGMKSSGQFCQGIKNIVKDAWQQLQFQHNWPDMGLSSLLWWLQTSKSSQFLSLSFVLQLWSWARCCRMYCVATVIWWALLIWVTWNARRKTKLFQMIKGDHWYLSRYYTRYVNSILHDIYGLQIITTYVWSSEADGLN
jgi:hypothetical protein